MAIAARANPSVRACRVSRITPIALGLLVCVVVVGAAVFGANEPRLHHRFPSMVDDWYGIAYAPDQLKDVIASRNPEEQRYRPGFIAWNALQWHTLDAPSGSTGPQFWGLLRLGLLVVGTTLFAALAILTIDAGGWCVDPRWLLVVGVPLAVLTAPTLAIDFARFGPQEPLLVGGMSLGAALLVWCLDRLLEPERPRIAVASITVVALAFWALGVTQKETSCCVLLLLPFLWPTIRAQRARWLQLHRRRRLLLGAIGAAILLPFLPMVVQTIRLSLAKERVYSDAASGRSLLERVDAQLAEASAFLHTPLFGLLGVAAIVVLAFSLLRRKPDWLAVGFLATAAAFVTFAAASGVVASRYYLPPLFLLGLVLARGAVSLGPRVATVAGVVLIATGAAQWHSARGWVEWWVEVEQGREALVRESAARAAAGCSVDVTGTNVELVEALPVLMPLADEPPRDCGIGRRVVVVIDNCTRANRDR